MESTVVTTQWLKQQIDACADSLVILDVTWYSSKDAREEHKKHHISGARYLDVMTADHSPLYPRNIPAAADFEARARSVGVNNDSHLVLYDQCPSGNGFFIGGRAWWTFKYYGHQNVSVLNGGLAKWTKDGYSTTQDETPAKVGSFVAKVDAKFKKPIADMNTNVDLSSFQVCDSRPSEKYQGQGSVLESKGGHYPGAKNISAYESLFNNEDGTLKSSDELKKVFVDAGIELERPLVTMCNSGMSSCTLCLAAHVTGADGAGLYHGGMTEWSAIQPTKVEK